MPKAGWIAWWALFLLGLLYILSFVDRFILALLVQPIKLRFEASDAQIGLLFGTSFALFYAICGLPLARYADTGNRILLIVVGALVWSLMTIGSAFAGSFMILLLMRTGVAIGEAALTPAAYSIIGDIFPPKRRVLAASIYTAAGMGGAGGSYIIGGMIISSVNNMPDVTAGSLLEPWQMVLIIVGIPGVILAALFGFTVGRHTQRSQDGGHKAGLGEVWEYFLANKILLLGLFGGAGFAQAIGYTSFGWMPEVLRRDLNWPIQNAGYAIGLMGIVSGCGGTLLVPQIPKMLQRAGVTSAHGLTSLVAVLLGTAFAVIAVFQDDGRTLICLLGAGLFLITGATSNIIVSTQELIPQDKRALAVAAFLLCITALGLGLGPYTAAFIASLLPEGPGQMRHAMAITFMAAAALSSICFIISMFGRSTSATDQTLNHAKNGLEKA